MIVAIVIAIVIAIAKVDRCRLTAVGVMCAVLCWACNNYVVLRHSISCVGRSVGFILAPLLFITC